MRRLPRQFALRPLLHLLVLLGALAFVTARADACGMGPGCCDPAVLECPMLAAGGAGAAGCASLCAALPQTAALARPAKAVGVAAPGGAVWRPEHVAAPEPPPPRPRPDLSFS